MSKKRLALAHRRHYRPHRLPSGEGAHWHMKRRLIIHRILRTIIIVVLLVLGGLTIASFLLTRVFEGDRHTARFVWFAGCALAISLPLLATTIAMRNYRRIAPPLIDVMAAADAVAEGDLSVRVSEEGKGEMGQLARSFNHMTAELERSDQQRRNLTADVAHELRTPLHIIQGNLEGILDGIYEPTSEHISATLDETRALARLVADLHTLSLAEMGKLPLVMEPVDVAELLEDIATSFSSRAESDGIELHVEIERETELGVYGDAGRLDQVLSNLVVNALRHTPRGGEITLRGRYDAGRVLLEVADTGEGISGSDLPFIFDRFWRGDPARAHKSGVGGGLGLAIARQLVEAHHGSISVKSTLGQGTQFQVVLPAASSRREQFV